MEMKHFYLSMALAGALTVQAVPVAKPYYGQVSEPGKSSVLITAMKRLIELCGHTGSTLV